MSLNQKFIYGLATNRLLTDVQDPDQAITNLGLIKSDFQVIQGANQEGVTNEDVMTVKGLDENIYPVLDRYTANLNVGRRSLEEVVGSDSPVIRGNLIINGQLAASGITYNKFDGSLPDNYRPLSISTAVNSAWSFFDLEFTNLTDLYYGNTVTVNNKLVVNHVASTQLPAQASFSAEIPTHLVRVKVGTEEYGLFAVEAAPLTFSGVFQNLRARIVRNNTWSGLFVSWRIRSHTEIQAQAEDVIGETVNVIFNSSSPQERTLEIYFPGSGLRELVIPNIGVRSWPTVILSQLLTLDVSNNQLLQMPPLQVRTPALKVLQLSGNRFYLGPEAATRRLSVAVGNLLPPTLEEFTAYDAFEGSMADSTTATSTVSVLNSLPLLRVFRAGRINSSASSLVGPDVTDTTGYFPDVTTDPVYDGGTKSRIVEYTVRDTTLRDLSKLANLRDRSPDLQILNLSGNNFTVSSNFSVSSEKIVTVNVASTRINIMDMRNRSELVTYLANNVSHGTQLHPLYVTDNPTSDTDYKFHNCAKLQNLDLSSSTYTGYLPRLSGNTSLLSFRAFNTRFSGGRPGLIITRTTASSSNATLQVAQGTNIEVNMMVSGVGVPANTTVISVNSDIIQVSNTVAVSQGVSLAFGYHVISEDMCADCGNLRVFDLLSGFLLSFAVAPLTFNNLRSLEFLRIQSNGRVGGNIPALNNCFNLTTLDMSNNSLIGAIPVLGTNTRLTSVNFSNNRLSGTLPTYNLPNLTVLSITNNLISGFAVGAGGASNIGSLPRLRQLRLNANRMQSSLPNLGTQTPVLERLEMQNNQMQTYVAGSLRRCFRLTFINLSNNRLNQTAINDIILDVDASVTAATRAGTLTLLGPQNQPPSSNTEVLRALARLRAAGWQIQVSS